MKVIYIGEECCDMTNNKIYEVTRWIKEGSWLGYGFIDDAGDRREMRRSYFIKANITLDKIFRNKNLHI